MSHGRDELQILIVGRTIEGLALAGFLRQADLEPIILDIPQQQCRSPICTLPPATLELFAQLGVADHLRECGRPISQWTVHRPAGNETNHFSAGEPAPIALPRSVVRDRLQRPIPAASIRTGARITSLSSNDAYAHIGLADGIEESFDLIVGADGPCSVVRSQLTDSSVNQRDRDALSIAATTERAAAGITEFHRPASLTISVNTGDRTRIQTCSPLIDNSTSDQTAEAPPSGLFPDRFDDLTMHSRDRIQSTYHTGQTWVAGRGVLLGPAAAALPPLAGIGLPLAIGDAAVFARSLLDAAGSLDEKLQEYARERHAARNDITNQIHRLNSSARPPHADTTLSTLVDYRELFRSACLEHPELLAA